MLSIIAALKKCAENNSLLIIERIHDHRGIAHPRRKNMNSLSLQHWLPAMAIRLEISNEPSNGSGLTSVGRVPYECDKLKHTASF